MINQMLYGDCLNLLKSIPDNSVDAIVTDPPYGISLMGKKWDYKVPSIEIWIECLRILKPGGYLLSFGSTRTYHRMVVAIEDAGFEIRDMIEWVYGSSMPKSLNIGKAIDKLQGNEREVFESKNIRPNSDRGNGLTHGEYGKVWEESKGTSEWEGWGSNLKPSHEPICMARKPLSENTITENCLKWGTGGINIDENRVETDEFAGVCEKRKPCDFDFLGNLYDNGYVGHKGSGATSNLGRFPSNLIIDNSEEVLSCFPINNGESTSRYFKSIIYQAKASKNEKNKWCEGLEDKNRNISLQQIEKQSGEVWIDRKDGKGKVKYNRNYKKTTKNNHPTVKPIALIEYLIKMVSRENAVIVDPFVGSGTTALACLNTNRQFIVMEKEKEYYDIIVNRVNNYKQENNTNKIKELF